MLIIIIFFIAHWYVTIGNFKNDASTTYATYGSSGYGCYYFIDDIIIQPSTILPVEFKSFTAEAGINNITLQWATASEKNNSGFEIERSSGNENDFNAIGWIGGNGTSAATHNYSFIDDSAGPGITYYYRLKQTDYDGAILYSETVDASIKGDYYALNVLYSDDGSIHISYNLGEEKNIKLDIVNQLGQVIDKVYDGKQQRGIYMYSVAQNHISNSPGLLIIRLVANNEVLTRKLFNSAN